MRKITKFALLIGSGAIVCQLGSCIGLVGAGLAGGLGVSLISQFFPLSVNAL